MLLGEGNPKYPLPTETVVLCDELMLLPQTFFTYPPHSVHIKCKYISSFLTLVRNRENLRQGLILPLDSVQSQTLNLYVSLHHGKRGFVPCNTNLTPVPCGVTCSEDST